MTNAEVIRAWKDPDYRSGLSTDEMSMLPNNPAGEISFDEDDMSGTHFVSRVICGSTPVDSCVKPPAACP